MKKFIYSALILLVLSSCSSTKLTTTSIGYQSIRTRHAQPTQDNPIPEDAEIAVVYTVSKNGDLTAIVYNRTSEIMTIDQTKSFFVNSDGLSTSYYDPTVRTTSTTTMSSTTNGATVNLGAIAGAFGVGGVVGQIANGINVGGSGTTGSSTTDVTYVADMPQVSIAPYGHGAMSKVFHIDGIGHQYLEQNNEEIITNIAEPQSYCRFSVCISYSLDNGETFDKIVTNFYANSKIVVPVAKTEHVNDALMKLYSTKPDSLNEYWWLLSFNNNYSIGYDSRLQGVLYDYK